MVPTCIDPDRTAAATVNRKTLTGYVKLPNYQTLIMVPSSTKGNQMVALQQLIDLFR